MDLGCRVLGLIGVKQRGRMINGPAAMVPSESGECVGDHQLMDLLSALATLH